MTSWNIDPDGVRLALSHTEVARDELATAVTPLPEALEQLFAACPGFVSSIPTALQAVVEQQIGDLRTVLTRVDAAVYGAARATGHYLQADIEMADTVQAAAIRAAATGEVAALQEVSDG